MKKICKSVAVFAIMAGLLCATSYAKSLKDALGSTKLGEKLNEKIQQNNKLNKAGGSSSSRGGWTIAAFSTNDSSKEYAGLSLEDNGEVEAIRYSNSTRVKGKWETSGSKKAIKNGDTITITVEDKTVKGTVRQTSSKYVKSDGDRGDFTQITYSLNLGAWGTYTCTKNDYGSGDDEK